jgi:hypothetical protein
LTALLATNIFIVGCTVVACFFSYKLWRLLDSLATLAFFLSAAYMVGFRIWVLVERQTGSESWMLNNQGYFLLPFWPLFALGIYLVYKTVKDTLEYK